MSARSRGGVVPEHPRAVPGLPIPRRSVLGYATGDLGISIAYFALGFFFLYYLTDLIGLPPALAGTVVLVGKIWDGVNDPLIGVLADRTIALRRVEQQLLVHVPMPQSFGHQPNLWGNDEDIETIGVP